jgi:hypothetical protein
VHWQRDISSTITASLAVYHPPLRLVGELEDERRENRLSATRASWSNDNEYYCTRLQWQVALDIFYKMRLQTAMIRRGRGVIEAATDIDVIKLFPATACSL